MSAARKSPCRAGSTIGLLPIINLVQALIVAGLVVMVIGVNPFEAMRIMAWGAVYDSVAISYTLYYATDFVFTGLAVAVAFHAGLFNIGGEGQAYIAGLGCTARASWRSTRICRASC
jgi:simple sugar transport system permease protein